MASVAEGCPETELSTWLLEAIGGLKTWKVSNIKIVDCKDLLKSVVCV